MGWLGNWFGAKSAPGPNRYMPLGRNAMHWRSEGVPRSYPQQLEEIYRSNPVGLRSVRLVAGTLSGLTLYAEGEQAAAAEKLVQRPALLETLAAHLLLHGNAYVRLVDDGAGFPSELIALRPERMTVATDAKGWPNAYLYRIGNAKPQRIERQDALGRLRMVHMKGLHPGDDHYGLGCLDAAIGAAAIHNAANRWNKALLDNAARPSGALVHAPADGASLTNEQFERLKEEMHAQFEGSDNAGRPLLLDGGLKWQALSLSPADMDFIALKEAAARDIALAFGVPPVLVGLPGDATYSNAREAGRALYRQTVLPLAQRMVTDLSLLLSDWLGEVSVKIDTDQLSELAEDRSHLWEQVGSADFLDREEKRRMLGFDEGAET